MSHEPDDWISLDEARRRLRVARPTLLKLVDDGRLTVMTGPGGRRRFRAAEVGAFIEASIKPATKGA